VVTWNTAELTASALRKLFDTDQGVELRVLVHDNASSDGTPDAVARAVPEAIIEVGPHNLGFAAAMNRLIARSDAPWFLALNSDAWPKSGAVGALVQAAEREPRAAAVAPRLERPDGTLEHSTHRFPSVKVAAMSAFDLQRWMGHRGEDLLLHGAWLHDRPRPVDWAVGAALLMRRQALDDIGGFDERFFMYVEDLEWCWRAREQGWLVLFEPTAIVCHVGNASGEAGYGRTRSAAYFRNTYRFYRRHHSRVSSVAYRAWNLVGSARICGQGIIRRDWGLIRYGRDQLLVHVRPVRGPDGPPHRGAGQ